MRRSFRFMPPEPRLGLLTRPRLLRSLAERWQHRVISLTGGPGLGKTTLLAQAIAENRLAPRGKDVWIGVEPHDADADRLAQVVVAALEGWDDDHSRSPNDQQPPDPRIVADVVWQQAPNEACLVFDDVHLLPSHSTGAAWLGGLVEALPTNGHVVFASRTEPPIRLARFGAQGAILRLGEDDLRFSEEELLGFATGRGLDPEHLRTTGGWPAIAELAATVEGSIAGEYLWEEVLEPLGTLRRHVLAVISDLGGADDRLASAALGTDVELVRALDGVPLVAQGADGWHVPHSLWRDAPGIELDPAERATMRGRAATHLKDRGRFDQAFGLLAEIGLWEAAPTVLREACLAFDRLTPSQLGRWLSRSSDEVRASTAGRLATGLYKAFTDPTQAIEALQEVVARTRADGDIDAEMAAIAQLGQLAWWRQDLDALSDLGARVIEVEPSGHPAARALATIARAMLADLAGDDATMLAELDSIESGLLDSVWEASAGWLCGIVHIDVGEVDAAHAIYDRLAPTADPAVRHMLEFLRCRAWWAEGRVDAATARFPALLEAEERSGYPYGLHMGQVFASVAFSYAGEVTAAGLYLNDALTTTPPSPTGARSVHVATALAAHLLSEGDEGQAAATLAEAVDVHGLEQGMERRAWRHALSLSYVLVPEARKRWDAAGLRGHLRIARDLSAAVVAVRQDRSAQLLRKIDLPDLGVVRACLHHRFAAELAVGLAAVGRAEGHQLLDALGPAGRAAVREVTSSSRLARPAKGLLAAVPAPPPQPTYLGVLGPLVVRRNGPEGEEVTDPDLRRQRVQTLLAFLVGHRHTSRSLVAAALWPDLDERSASNNLSVTLSHLLHVLEPWRDSGEPSYLVRLDGQTLRLVAGDHLRIDVDEFGEHLAAAAQAELDGTPSLALDHHLAAVDLYRGDLHLDVPEADWFLLEREHYRTRFVTAAIRAGQLLLGRGDVERAQSVAHRALEVDTWAEEAYAVLVKGALTRGDRSAAYRLLTHCLEALADLGVEPSESTHQLRRRLLGAEPDAA
jgi:LuxR family maltose regulon positive regulatory protein